MRSRRGASSTERVASDADVDDCPQACLAGRRPPLLSIGHADGHRTEEHHHGNRSYRPPRGPTGGPASPSRLATLLKHEAHEDAKQYVVKWVLWERGTVPQAQLCQRLHLDGATCHRCGSARSST